MLSELYQKGSEESESRVQELLGAVEKIQGLLDQVSQEKEQLQTSISEDSIRFGHMYIVYNKGDHNYIHVVYIKLVVWALHIIIIKSVIMYQERCVFKEMAQSFWKYFADEVRFIMP